MTKSQNADTVWNALGTRETNEFAVPAVQLADEVWILGREQGKPGATVVKRMNLADRGLAWDPNILHNDAYWPTVLEIKELFHKI